MCSRFFIPQAERKHTESKLDGVNYKPVIVVSFIVPLSTKLFLYVRTSPSSQNIHYLVISTSADINLITFWA